jgi:hypothetical protein
MSIHGEWAQVRQVFEGALAVPAEARDGYLTDACGADQALRQQLELLLASHNRAGGFRNTAGTILRRWGHVGSRRS